MTTLTTEEQTALANAEKIVSQGLASFESVATALIEIRDLNLWRGGYESFQHYCRSKWGIGTRRFQQLCAATETVSELRKTNNCSLPENESQVRQLTKLETPEQKSEAWTSAQQAAAKEQRPVTAKDVETAVAKIQEPQPPTLDDKFAQGLGHKDASSLILNLKKKLLEDFSEHALRDLANDPESLIAMKHEFEVYAVKFHHAANNALKQAA